MTESPIEPGADPEAKPTDDPEIVPSSDPGGGSTIIPPRPTETEPRTDD